jgi:hypothetical protein
MTRVSKHSCRDARQPASSSGPTFRKLRRAAQRLQEGGERFTSG